MNSFFTPNHYWRAEVSKKVIYQLTPIHFAAEHERLVVSGPLLVPGSPWWLWANTQRREKSSPPNAKQLILESTALDDAEQSQHISAPNVMAGALTPRSAVRPKLPFPVPDLAQSTPHFRLATPGPPNDVGLYAFSENAATPAPALELPLVNRVPGSPETSDSSTAALSPEGGMPPPTLRGIAQHGNSLVENPPAAIQALNLPVFAVPAALAPKNRFSLVVVAGASGGGGLDVYGVLRCGQIITTILPMPNQSWTLEFCEPESSAATASGTLQPPEARERFDFIRPELSSADSAPSIILHGWIQADGSVELTETVRGVAATTDAAAARAFSQWKFSPASRNGIPVRVEILVGIPASENR